MGENKRTFSATWYLIIRDIELNWIGKRKPREGPIINSYSRILKGDRRNIRNLISGFNLKWLIIISVGDVIIWLIRSDNGHGWIIGNWL